MIEPDIVELLEREAARINTPGFVDSDPVQFPRRFTDLRDIEITALVVSAIAWGNRKSILADADKMLSLMGHTPYKYTIDEGYEDLPDRLNIHRTFFGSNLKHFLRGLRAVYANHASLDSFAHAAGAHCSPFPAWTLAEAINRVLAEANDGRGDSRCLPLNTDVTALKRLNMALRWLVRDDGVVDMGVWRSLRPSQLFVPLDVHVSRISRELGLLTRRSNDRKAVVELTETLRELRPDDPAYFDFALFGIGVTGKSN